MLRWFGALLFVVSLAVGGKTYFVNFDAVAPDGSPVGPALAWNVALFSAFALHHSVLARTPIKTWLRARVGPAHERSLYVIAASLLFLLTTRAWAPLPGTWYALSGPSGYAGASIQWLGVALIALAARAVDVRELMGLSAPALRPLESRGAYARVRHPLYLGWTLFVLGAPHMTSTRLAFALISIAYVVVAIPFEERSLAEAFGPAYDAYRRQVPWRLVPGIY